MKSILLAIPLILGSLQHLNAKDLEYPLSDIPQSLLKNANSVIRLNETEYSLYGYGFAKMKVRYAITLMNTKASDLAELSVYYDNNSYVSYLNFEVFDALGLNITHSFRKLEVKDESAIDDGTMYSDDRCKVVSPVFAQYPVTIEYSYEVCYNRVMHYPRWMPQNALNMSLQKASFTLTAPKDLTIRHKETNSILPPVISEVKSSSKQMVWEIKDIPALEYEAFEPPLQEMLPCLDLAPGKISYKDFDGQFLTWDDYGKFIAYLNKDRDKLPEETIGKIQSLTRDCRNDKEKVRTIYKYMQGRTRYVSVQIGIGGLQPIAADFVDKKGYGDCKGLVNYTKALLKSVGIDSYYTLIKAGDNVSNLNLDFPNDNFNHIILCVPLKGDTTWLECTSQRQAFGFLGSFTHNRDALIVTDNGGKMVRTPKYDLSRNTSERNGRIKLDEYGDASAVITTVARGIESENVEAVIRDSQEDQKKGYYKRSRLPDSKINSLSYSLDGDYFPVGKEAVDVFIPAFASKSGNRIFLPVVLPDRYNVLPAGNIARTHPVDIREAFAEHDTIRLSLPEGFSMEFKPAAQTVDSKFGSYSLSVELQGNELISIRSFSLYENRYEASEYNDFIAFLRKTVKADQTKVVLLAKN